MSGVHNVCTTTTARNTSSERGTEHCSRLPHDVGKLARTGLQRAVAALRVTHPIRHQPRRQPDLLPLRRKFESSCRLWQRSPSSSRRAQRHTPLGAATALHSACGGAAQCTWWC
jgi:hypothetical protein